MEVDHSTSPWDVYGGEMLSGLRARSHPSGKGPTSSKRSQAPFPIGLRTAGFSAVSSVESGWNLWIIK